MTVYEGKLVIPAKSPRVGIIVSRFNELVTERLLEGAVAVWRRYGGDESALEVVRVPGAFEMPLVARKLAETGRFDAIICLGCVIRGATDHYDYVCGQAASGIMQASVTTGIPVLFGVLTTNTLEQAEDRAGAKAGNKGAEAMTSALEMVNLLASIEGSQA